MRLYHFSDNPGICIFMPRPVRVPSTRAEGREWLNGPLVWAMEADRDFLYHFPRDCPRIVIWATERSAAHDRAQWLGQHRAVAYIERQWLQACATAVIYRYRLPPDSFEPLDDAGMWVSRTPVTPLACTTLADLPNSLAARKIDLRVVDSLLPLRQLWATSLHTSGIRLRNAASWG